MPILSSSTIKSLGFGYIQPPVPITGLSVTTAYSTNHVATATWTPSTSPSIATTYIQWYIGTTATSSATLSGGASSATLSVSGGASVKAQVWVQNAGAKQSIKTMSASVMVPPEPLTLSAIENGASAGFVNLSWTRDNTGATTSTVTRTVEATTTTILNNQTNTSITNDNAGGSSIVTYTIFGTNAGGNGPSTTTTITTKPQIPQNPVITAFNPGRLNFSFSPVTPNIINYTITLYQNNTFLTNVVTTATSGILAPPSTPPTYYSPIIHNASYKIKVTAKDIFDQVSQSSVDSSSVLGINDLTPPNIPTPTVTSTSLFNGWNNTVEGFTLNWTGLTDSNGSAITASLDARYQDPVQGWSTWSSIYSIPNPTSSGSFNHKVPYDKRNNVSIEYRISARDEWNNSSVGNSISRIPKPKGNFTILATKGVTWKTSSPAGWRSDADSLGTMYSNYTSSSYAWQYGYWFYNSDNQTTTPNIIASTCRGFVPDAGSLTIRKVSGRGQPGYHHVALHTYNAHQPFGSPIIPDLSGYFLEKDGPNIAASTTEFDSYFTLPSDWLQSFSNGTAKGVVMVTNSGLYGNTSNQYYRVVYTPAGYLYSGRLVLDFY